MNHLYEEMDLLKKDRSRTIEHMNSLKVQLEACMVVNNIIPRHSGTDAIHEQESADSIRLRNEIGQLEKRLYLVDSGITRLLWKQKSWEIARLRLRRDGFQRKVDVLNEEINRLQSELTRSFRPKNVLPDDLIPVDLETVDEELLDEAASVSP